MKDRIIDTLMPLLAPLSVVLLVALLCLANPAEAEAAPMKAGTSTAPTVATMDAECIRCEGTACSLPYVDDVNDWGPGKVIVTVCCCGDAAKYQLKVTNPKGKKVKVTKVKRDVWTVVLKKGKTYKLSVRPKGGKWRSIRYGVC